MVISNWSAGYTRCPTLPLLKRSPSARQAPRCRAAGQAIVGIDLGRRIRPRSPASTLILESEPQLGSARVDSRSLNHGLVFVFVLTQKRTKKVTAVKKTPDAAPPTQPGNYFLPLVGALKFFKLTRSARSSSEEFLDASVSAAVRAAFSSRPAGFPFTS